MMKLILVDDNKAFREGIKFYLECILHHEVIGMASNGKEFLDLNNKLEADAILMDIEMPLMNGIEATKLALWEWEGLKVIAITNYRHMAYLKDLILAGFRACIFKDKFYDEFDNTIFRVLEGDLVFPKNIKTEEN